MSQSEIINDESGQKLIFKEYIRGVDLEYTLSEGKLKKIFLFMTELRKVQLNLF
ncbi:MAG: hypothetical protein ACLRXU_00135 [Barnesiella intestinihominis]